MKTPNTEAEYLAFSFHRAYERLAPEFGYETRPETRAFDLDSPNGKLMVAVAQHILDSNLNSLKQQAGAWHTVFSLLHTLNAMEGAPTGEASAVKSIRTLHRKATENEEAASILIAKGYTIAASGKWKPPVTHSRKSLMLAAMGRIENLQRYKAGVNHTDNGAFVQSMPDSQGQLVLLTDVINVLNELSNE